VDSSLDPDPFLHLLQTICQLNNLLQRNYKIREPHQESSAKQFRRDFHRDLYDTHVRKGKRFHLEAEYLAQQKHLGKLVVLWHQHLVLIANRHYISYYNGLLKCILPLLRGR